MSEKTGVSQSKLGEIIRSRIELEDIKFPDKYDISADDVFELIRRGREVKYNKTLSATLLKSETSNT